MAAYTSTSPSIASVRVVHGFQWAVNTTEFKTQQVAASCDVSTLTLLRIGTLHSFKNITQHDSELWWLHKRSINLSSPGKRYLPTQQQPRTYMMIFHATRPCICIWRAILATAVRKQALPIREGQLFDRTDDAAFSTEIRTL